MLMLFLCGCGTLQQGVLVGGFVADTNRNKLDKLEVGMTKEQVKGVMGQPYKREAYGGVEYWLYLTDHPGYNQIPDDSSYTPIAFVNGKVDGWGRNYYQERKHRIEADININT